MRTPARAAALAITALLLATGPAVSAVTEFVVPSGPIITLQDGRTIDGHIMRIDQTDVDILSADGSLQTLPRSTVDTVAFETVTGEKLVGELVGWSPGVYQITTSEAAIKVYSTMPAVPAVPSASSPTIAGADSNQSAAAAEPETADSGEGSTQAIAAVDQTTNGAPAAADVDIQDAAATPATDLSIEVTVENSKENGPPVVFNIALSRPSDSSVVLIYATIDGTAINGQDYEANRGVVVIKPGDQVARIEAPVLDDGEVEGQEHLQLFLTVDPTVAIVQNRQIIATIDDDDQG